MHSFYTSSVSPRINKKQGKAHKLLQDRSKLPFVNFTAFEWFILIQLAPAFEIILSHKKGWQVKSSFVFSFGKGRSSVCIKPKLFGVWYAALPEDVSLLWQPSSEAPKMMVGTAGLLGWTRGDVVTWGFSTPSLTSQTGLGHGSSEHGGDIAWAHATVGTSPRSGQDGHLHPNEHWPAFGQGNICFPYSDLLLGEVLPKPHQDFAFPLPARAEFSSFWVESPAGRPGGGIQAVPQPAAPPPRRSPFPPGLAISHARRVRQRLCQGV